MVTVARINIWGVLVGAVAWDAARRYASFEYDRAFLKRGWDLAPLCMSIEEAQRGNGVFTFKNLNYDTFKGLPGMLADSLPDRFGNKLIDTWLAQQGRSADSLNPVERLCYTGTRGMGALEYAPVLHSIDSVSEPVEVQELVKLVQEALDERRQWHTNIHDKAGDGLLDIVRVGTSAGGARPKAIIAYNQATGDVRSGQVDGLPGYAYWIIKFDGVDNNHLGDPKGYGMIEYAYYLMATEAGITMSPSKLLHENNRAHFMTQRFDRVVVGDSATDKPLTQKLHTQTLCALAHYDYNDTLSYSYEQALQVMRQLRLPYPDMEQLYRRMVFNVVARNQDDHTKNISLIMNRDGVWRLSPAYDVTYAYDPVNKWMKAHQMSVNGKHDTITRADLLAVAKRMDIKKPADIINQVIDAVSRWSSFAKTAGVHAGQIKAINKVLLLSL